MKNIQTKQLPTLLPVIGLCAVLMLTMGALNGGTALSASAFDAAANYIKNSILHSTFIHLLALIGIVIGAWKLTHGEGMSVLGWVFGTLLLGIAGPDLATSIETSVSTPKAYVQPAVMKKE